MQLKVYIPSNHFPLQAIQNDFIWFHSYLVESPHVCREPWLTRIFVELLVFVRDLCADFWRVPSDLVGHSRSNFELDSVGVAAFEGAHHSMASARSGFVADDLCFIVMECLDF